MEYSVKISSTSDRLSSDCLIVAVYEQGELSPSAQQIDEASSNYLSNLIKQGDITGKFESSLLLQQIPNVMAKRVLVIGAGKKQSLNRAQFQKLLNKAFSVLSQSNVSNAHCTLADLEVDACDCHWKVRETVLACAQSQYRFEEFKQDKNKNEPLASLCCTVANQVEIDFAQSAIQEGQAIAAGIAFTKDLGNRPGNVCTPTHFASQAKQLAKTFSSIKHKVLDEGDMEKNGMGSFLSVSAGSEQQAKLIILEYNGAAKDVAPIALVGKGITFDAGGISLKPPAAMDEMKYDMMGAASVLGTIKAIATMELPINVVGAIACSENLINGKATKPGDIVTSMSGQTIEILNTDAEGRLVLCDTLTYVKKYEPDTVIDLATLTGAILVALGHVYSGVFTDDDTLAEALIEAGEQTNDIAWRMPMHEKFDESLKSNFADMANIGSRWGGSCVAANFLARFTKDITWAHMDIAGSAFQGGEKKGATGRPVPLLCQYLINRSLANG